MLDNIMVGQLCTESMSGVSIVNQFVFVFNLLIFGAVSAAGIFTAQFHGSRDREGVMYTFRFKIGINVLAALASIAVFYFCSDWLISLFLHEGSEYGDLALTLREGRDYLRIMILGLIPYAISQAYASTMRETEQTVLPMLAGAAAVAVNTFLNWVLIFGYLGVPALGVKGAAIATVLSRFCEWGILAVWAAKHPEKCDWLCHAFRSLRVPRKLFTQIAVRGLPLMLNEFFWSLAVTLRNQCYSLRNLDVVAAQNISSTLSNLFNCVFLTIGSTIAIVVGKQLGEGQLEKAKDSARKMMVFSLLCSVGMGLIMCLFAPLFPKLYNTSNTVRSLACFMILASAAIVPFNAFANSAYFTLRSGGKVLITLLFDSVYMWVIVMPIVYVLSHCTDMGIHWLYFIGQATEIAKCLFGYFLLKRGTWVRKLVDNEPNLPQMANE